MVLPIMVLPYRGIPKPTCGLTPLGHHCLSARPLYHPIRHYATPRPYKSGPAAPLSTHTSPTNTITTPEPHDPLDPINPPPTTRPPPLNLPSRGDLPLYKNLYTLGRTYLTFYKTGLQGIWTNLRLANAKYPFNPLLAPRSTIYAACTANQLSRSELQTLLRLRRDVGKLPLFALVFLVCGEFTPFVVVFMSGVVPRILWIPKQEQKAREKAELRRKSIAEGEVRSRGPVEVGRLENLKGEEGRNARIQVGRSLGLFPSWWDRWPLFVVDSWVLRRRLINRLRELEIDDAAILRDGGERKMIEDEVRMACEMRGFDVLGKEETGVRRELAEWLAERRELTSG